MSKAQTRTSRTDRSSGKPQQQLTLHVLGAAGDVTGSLNLFEYRNGSEIVRFIVDAGLDQSDDTVNHENRFPSGVTAADINFIIVSHAHIDHSGFVPALVKAGFKGPVYATAATSDIMEFLLPDSGYLAEERARRANRLHDNLARRRFSGKSRGQSPRAKPLYTEKEARKSMSCVRILKMDRAYELATGVSVRLTEACHILGAAVVNLEVGTGNEKRTFCFSGNIGRPNTPILRDLAPVSEGDYLMCESTYGNKLHEKRDRLQVLSAIVNRAYLRARPSKKQGKNSRGCGVIIIPAFAVGRVQSVLYDLRQLMADKRIPEIPVYVDSPMANRATAVHRKYRGLYNREAQNLISRGIDPFTTPRYAECKNESESALLDKPLAEPIIIVASSGMAAGGRILQHLRARLPGEENTVLFVGYQGSGTLGKALVQDKSKEVQIHGETCRVRASIEYMGDYSGHADYNEILSWLRQFKRKPKCTFLVHGEPVALEALKKHIEEALGWTVVIPRRRQQFNLS
jgi:metallo-beta-lactamase family protein